MKSWSDTIAAVATPLGEGAVGIVRLSGPDSIAIARRIFLSARGKDLATSSQRVYYGEIKDGCDVLDEVLVHIMRGPCSYTREDVVEINCHGGAGPLHAVLELVLRQGARLAEPGEFTRRAFLNGRIDLVQAEAVIDRIRAQTRAALRAASSASEGALSKALAELSDALVNALARVEAAVDFPEEDLPELVDPALRTELERTLERMDGLLATADAGRLIREGAQVAIAGRPNVGKSSLFNALLRDARAIVTNVPGTTRDVLEEVITVEGIPVRLSDTAGLRDTVDTVERIGVDIARKALRASDAVLFVLDATAPCTPEDETLAEDLRALDVPVLVVLNKIDAVQGEPRAPAWAADFAATVPVSAITGEHLKTLESALARILLHGDMIVPGRAVLTRVHQTDSLRRARTALSRMLDHYDASPEFLSLDLREAIDAIGEITGETTSEDVLTRIFSSFCIGK